MKFTGYGTTYTLYGNTFVGISWQIIRLRVFDVQVRLWSFRLEQKQKKKIQKIILFYLDETIIVFLFFCLRQINRHSNVKTLAFDLIE